MSAQSSETSHPKGRVMIIDDEPAMGHILVKSLKADGFYAVAHTDPAAGYQAISTDQPDVILTDFKMPQMTGRELLHRIRDQYPEIPVLIMTAYGTIEDAVAMLKAGAFNYITKPFQHENLAHQIDMALSHRKLKQEVQKLAEHADGQSPPRFMVGKSDALKQVRDLIQRAARTDSVVLITGESGSGKELVARDIHRFSSRGNQRFLAVNCPAIPATLIESELFGYERGAFTGAERSKMGLIELSSGGTLFLDEIGELPIDLQAKLLRVLQEREVQRLGGLKQIPVDLRVIAATHRDLEANVSAGLFRADLYYRLKVLMIRVPSLRERSEDIPALAHYFLSKLARRLSRPDLKLGPGVVRFLKSYVWPGNVRELENAVERMVAMTPGDLIQESDIPPDLFQSAQNQYRRNAQSPEDSGEGPSVWPLDFKDARERFERSYFRQLLQASGGKMAMASRISGISRRHLYEKMEKLDLSPKGTKEEGEPPEE